MNDTVILTFTYPLIEPYFKDFLLSCERQTNKDFDIIIVNDGLESLKSIISEFLGLKYIIKDFRGSISENRLYGLQLCKYEGYKYIILADSDDFFSNNRVQKTKEFLERYEIVSNDFDLVNIKGETIESQYISNRIVNGQIIDYESIKTQNILGFSNSAFRADIIPLNLSIPKVITVVDWFFYTILLYQGHKAIFTNEMITYYRQYDDNMIGINNETTENYRKKLLLKSKHYQYLSKLIPDFKSLSEKYKKAEILDDNQIKILLNKNRITYPLWWENIII